MGKNQISDAERLNLISDSYSTPQKPLIKEKNIFFLTKLN